MVRNFPQTLTPNLHVARHAPSAVEEVEPRESLGLLARLVLMLKQLICALHGHDRMLNFQQSRVLLVCTSCGHESPGWDVGQRRPRVRYQGDARRHLMSTHAPAFIITRKSA